MYSPDAFAYRDWLGSLADSKTDLIVRSSREQSWTGLDVALLRYTDQQIAAPAFSSHLIVLHLTQIPRFIGKVNRQTYEAPVREGESSILAAGVASEWQWQMRGQLHLGLERAFVRQVADEHGHTMSQSHFTRQFKQSLGITPHQYVIQCRVERARLLLQRGELTIRQVATVVGFVDQSHLTYHFKRILGITPNQFLQQ